jgi:hypothetical protein
MSAITFTNNIFEHFICVTLVSVLLTHAYINPYSFLNHLKQVLLISSFVETEAQRG